MKKWRIYLSLRSIFANKFISKLDLSLNEKRSVQKSGSKPVSRKNLSLIAILVYNPIRNDLTDFKPHKQRVKLADL